MEHTEQYIKSQLFELLQSDSDNYSQILTLSNELAQMDKKNIRFSVDAGIITRLGKELVGKGETADMHLIKAKLNDREFAVIELFKTLIDKDRQNAVLRENLRRTREEAFGTQ